MNLSRDNLHSDSNAFTILSFFSEIRAHRAPVPEPIEEPLPGEHPVPQEDPVPSPNPEVEDPRH